MRAPMPQVAFDVTPLLSSRTGIGLAVHEMWHALKGLSEGPDLRPYAFGLRAVEKKAELEEAVTMVRWPTRVLLAAWSRVDRPRFDRPLAGADVVHATNYVVPPTRIPTVVTINDLGFVLDPSSADSVTGRFGAVLRRALDRGVHVHVTTEQVASEVEACFGPGLVASGRVVVIPYGVPRIDEPGPIGDRLAAGLAGRPFVLTLGRQDVRKNLRRLVDAFGLVATDDTKDGAGLCLVLAGPPGADTPAIEAAVARLPNELRDRVLRPGYVTAGERAALMRQARALAYPSLYEGFGFPPLEAMVAETPVLVGRGGAVGEVTGPAAEQVDATDVQDLAAGLRRVVFDETRRSELIEAGRRHAATFTWERTARDLARMYETVARLADPIA